MLTGLGVETGVDLEQLVATSVWMAEQLGRPSPSAVNWRNGSSGGLRGNRTSTRWGEPSSSSRNRWPTDV